MYHYFVTSLRPIGYTTDATAKHFSRLQILHLQHHLNLFVCVPLEHCARILAVCSASIVRKKSKSSLEEVALSNLDN